MYADVCVRSCHPLMLASEQELCPWGCMLILLLNLLWALLDKLLLILYGNIQEQTNVIWKTSVFKKESSESVIFPVKNLSDRLWTL